MTEHLRPYVPPLFTPPSLKRTALELAHLSFLQRVASLRVPRIVGQADGDDIRALSDYLVEVANAVDAHVEAIGREAASNANGIELGLFKNNLFKAVEGNALHTLDDAASALDEELTEVL